MAKVDLFDEILIEQGRRPGIELACRGPCWAPDGKNNLVYKACEMLLDHCGSRADIKITLTKNIPAGSGLGSASSDAAAALMGVNRFLQLAIDSETLSRLAAGLGSDAAFFMNGPLAFCTGRGERIEKLGENFNFCALLIMPDVSVSTKKVYANYKHDWTIYERLSAKIKNLMEKNRIDLVCGMCANMLETSCFGFYKELGEFKDRIESLGIRPVCLSGSGSTLFWLADVSDRQNAEENRRKLEEKVDCKSVIVSNNRW